MSESQIETRAYVPDEFVDRESEINLVTGKVDGLAQNLPLDKRTVIFMGQRGTGKSWLLTHLYRTLEEEAKLAVFLLNLADFEVEEDTLSAVKAIISKLSEKIQSQGKTKGTTLDELSQDLITKVQSKLAQQPMALFVDSVYEADWELLTLLEDHLLGPLAIESNVLIVMAGRGHPYPWKTPELRLKADFWDLEPFDQKRTIEQLSRQNPEAVAQGKEIYDLSGGNPLANSLLAATGDPHEGLNQVIKGILQTVPVSRRGEMQQHLEALCVLHSFDEERIPIMLAVYYNDHAYLRLSYLETRQIREEIVRWAFARWNDQQGGYVIDNYIRNLVERYLKTARTAKWKALHCAAYRLYKEWIADYPRAEDRWRQEIDYHWTRLNEAGVAPEDCFVAEPPASNNYAVTARSRA